MAMRDILFVAHDYLPLETTGAQRVKWFARHLPALEFQPLVLTTTRFGRSSSDQTAGIHRAPDWIHDGFLPLRRRRARGGAGEILHEVPVFERGTLLGRLRDSFMVPDTRLGWLWPAVGLGEALIREHRPALVFSSSPPETAHLVAGRLARRHALPWVADLRDGWTFEPPVPELRRGALRRRLELRLERALARRADAITVATAPIAGDLRARYPDAADRVVVLTNGFDPGEFENRARKRAADGQFLIVHTGSLSASRRGTTPQTLFAALALIARRDPRTTLRVRFVGSTSEEERSAARAHGVANLVSFVPPVSRSEAHQHQIDADALLLITAPSQRSVATLKLYDYIGAGKPILALARGNAAAEIVERYRLGATVAPDDPEAVAAALLRLSALPGATPDDAGLAAARRAFDWRNLTADLAAVFERVLAAAPPPR